MTKADVPRILHLTTGEITGGSVYDSQVVRPMGLLGQDGVDVALVNYVSARAMLNSRERRKFSDIKSSIKSRTGLATTILAFTPKLARGLWSDANTLGALLRLRFHSPKGTILHCRGTLATHIALKASCSITNVAVISDVRGFAAPEFLMEKGYDHIGDAPPDVVTKYYELDRAQREALAGAHATLYVSEAMKSAMRDIWSLPPKLNRVIPCCTDVLAGREAAARRTDVRKKLGLSAKFVVAYCGSGLTWQLIPETISLFCQIASMRRNAHFLVVTTDLFQFRQELEKAGVPSDLYTLIKVANDEVAPLLAAADLGILLRKNSAVNRVASPVKFAEYLSCGVPVVLSDGIGDISSIAHTAGVGCLVSVDNIRENTSVLQRFIDRIDASGDVLRRFAIDCAGKYFSWSHYITDYEEMYAEIAHGWGRR